MASIKVKFRPSTVKGQEGTIYYQLIHRRKIRQLLTDYHVFGSEWNEKSAKLKTSPSYERHDYLAAVNERIKRDLKRLDKVIKDFEEKNAPYTADDVIGEYNKYVKAGTLFSFMERLIARFLHEGKTRTAETYISALNSFKKFRNYEDISFDNISTDIMENYQAFLQNRRVTANTISFYMRILRAVYNRAVDDGMAEQSYPFRRVYTGIGKTVKRALPLTLIKKIKNLDLTYNSKLDYARDMFMMSFYLRGMSFVDMAYLRKSDLQNGSVVYRRRKTGQQLTIGWTDEMQTILDKYPRNSGEYLLPIIGQDSSDERKDYIYTGHSINRNLHKIRAILKINCRLTMYAARHSWASIAKIKGIPLSVISEGLGHNSEATTQIYLTSLDTSVIDRANRLIISML